MRSDVLDGWKTAVIRQAGVTLNEQRGERLKDADTTNI